MQSLIAVTLVTLTLAIFASTVSSYTRTTLEPLNLTPTRSNFKACITKFNKEGRCVHESYCNDDHEIEVGGVIDESELREFSCMKGVEWCCSDKNVTTLPPPPPTIQKVKCAVSNRPDCPWCVKLYRDGEDWRKLDSGLFCMGTMIASNVILSTGTCMIQAQNQTLWAHVPNALNPNTNYTVKYRLVHPDYNSGTRANDLALLVVDKEVEWGPGGSKGACIGVSSSLIGDCIGAGIDGDENIDMTPLLVNEGTCGGGSPVDASCGHLIGEACSVIPGTPIMCRVGGGPFMVVGQAKMNCLFDPPKALLGNLKVASKWLIAHLKGTMGLQEVNFLYNTEG